MLTNYIQVLALIQLSMRLNVQECSAKGENRMPVNQNREEKNRLGVHKSILLPGVFLSATCCILPTALPKIYSILSVRNTGGGKRIQKENPRERTEGEEIQEIGEN